MMTYGEVWGYCEGTLEVTLGELKSLFKVLLGHSGGIYGTNLGFLLGNFWNILGVFWGVP